MDDVYYTIAKAASIEIKRKGSRFIAETNLAAGTGSALEQLERIRKREHSATHHCYAYRVGLLDEIEYKYSDDGEPNGTAGRPIYDVVCGRGITNILLVVTRYFGGTKLGTGGLVRAYSDAARNVMETSGRQEHYLTERIAVTIDFSLYDSLAKIVRRLQATQNRADFSDHVSLELEVRKTKADHLITEIVQLSAGKAKIEKIRPS